MARTKLIVPTSAADISKAKAEAGNIDTTVAVNSKQEIFYRPQGAPGAGRGGYVVHRGQHVKKTHKLGVKAAGMKACAGKRGCEFAACLDEKGIRPPKSVNKACSGVGRYTPRAALEVRPIE